MITWDLEIRYSGCRTGLDMMRYARDSHRREMNGRERHIHDGVRVHMTNNEWDFNTRDQGQGTNDTSWSVMRHHTNFVLVGSDIFLRDYTAFTYLTPLILILFVRIGMVWLEGAWLRLYYFTSATTFLS